MKKVFLNRHKVVEFCCKNDLSIYNFCKICKISFTNFTKHLEDENKPIKITTLFKISRGTNLGIGEFAIVEDNM